jgi:hypothetical protein
MLSLYEKVKVLNKGKKALYEEVKIYDKNGIFYL